MQYTSNLDPDYNKDSGFTSEKYREFNLIADSLEDSNIYVPANKQYKNSFEAGWDEKHNLITKNEAKTHLRKGGNISLKLGTFFNNVAYVGFDVEQKGILPEALRVLIDTYALETHKSLHDGLNRIVRVNDREVYELLDSIPKTHTNVTEGDSEDIELLINDSITLPPSKVNHKHCNDTKPCNGKDRVGGYDLIEVNPEAPTLQVEAVEQICDILNVDPEREKEPDYTSEEEVSNVPSPSPSFNIQEEFNDNVPSIEHSFSDRLEYMKFGDWKGQTHFLELYNGNFSNVSGSNKQGKAEMKLANYIGFFFGNNKDIVRLLMDNVPFDSHYSKYDSHRKTLLEYATSVDWCYCDNLHLGTKYDIALEIWLNESITKTNLKEKAEVSKSHIDRILTVLKTENVIETKNKDELTIENKAITQSYIERLDNIAEERTDNDNNPEKTNSNVSRVSI